MSDDVTTALQKMCLLEVALRVPVRPEDRKAAPLGTTPKELAIASGIPILAELSEGALQEVLVQAYEDESGRDNIHESVQRIAQAALAPEREAIEEALSYIPVDADTTRKDGTIGDRIGRRLTRNQLAATMKVGKDVKNGTSQDVLEVILLALDSPLAARVVTSVDRVGIQLGSAADINGIKSRLAGHKGTLTDENIDGVVEEWERDHMEAEQRRGVSARLRDRIGRRASSIRDPDGPPMRGGWREF